MTAQSNSEILALISREIVHYYSSSGTISSKHRSIFVLRMGVQKIFKMPFVLADFLGFSRILRRVLRLDKCNIFPISDDFSRLLVIRQSRVYVLDTVSECFEYKFTLKNCRNLMHNSICRTPTGRIIFGEYGANQTLKPVPVHTSDDNGYSWREVNFFQDGEVKHIHNVSYDRYSGNVWIMTGDFEGQCKLLMCSVDLELIDVFGDGSQFWRTCGIFFESDAVYWLMDSPNEAAKVVKLDRETKELAILSGLAGPVWYIKRLRDDVMVAGVTVEPGTAVNTSSAQLSYSTNYVDWNVALEFPKDKWSMRFFKYGVISFSDGEQSSNGCLI